VKVKLLTCVGLIVLISTGCMKRKNKPTEASDSIPPEVTEASQDQGVELTPGQADQVDKAVKDIIKEKTGVEVAKKTVFGRWEAYTGLASAWAGELSIFEFKDTTTAKKSLILTRVCFDKEKKAYESVSTRSAFLLTDTVISIQEVAVARKTLSSGNLCESKINKVDYQYTFDASNRLILKDSGRSLILTSAKISDRPVGRWQSINADSQSANLVFWDFKESRVEKTVVCQSGTNRAVSVVGAPFEWFLKKNLFDVKASDTDVRRFGATQMTCPAEIVVGPLTYFASHDSALLDGDPDSKVIKPLQGVFMEVKKFASSVVDFVELKDNSITMNRLCFGTSAPEMMIPISVSIETPVEFVGDRMIVSSPVFEHKPYGTNQSQTCALLFDKGEYQLRYANSMDSSLELSYPAGSATPIIKALKKL
jgi:hypothetical protein